MTIFETKIQQNKDGKWYYTINIGQNAEYNKRPLFDNQKECEEALLKLFEDYYKEH